MSRRETQTQNAVNELKQANKKRHWYGHKELQEVLGIRDLLKNGKRYSQLPIGFMASIGIQLTPKEAILFTLILEETYSAGYIEWHYSQRMVARFAKKYALWGLKDSRAIRASFNALHNAGIIENYVKRGRQHSVVKICRGTFEVWRFENMDQYRTDPVKEKGKTRNPNPKRGFNFNTKDALIDMGCNTYSNSSSLLNFEGLTAQDSNDNLSGLTTEDKTHLEGLTTEDNLPNNDGVGASDDPKSSSKSIIKREEEREVEKKGENRERKKLEFINYLRSNYANIPIVVEGKKYVFNKIGHLCTYPDNERLASGMAISLYETLYENRELLLEVLDRYIKRIEEEERENEQREAEAIKKAKENAPTLEEVEAQEERARNVIAETMKALKRV